MPSVPYSPVPDVSPSTAQPSNYFTQQASPAAFGAQIGQATEGLGQSLEQAGAVGSDLATRIQTVHNNVAADGAFNQHQTNVNNILYGDPSKPGDSGYYGLHGQDALNARPGVLQALEDSRTNIRGGLQNTQQQLQFDEASRRLNMYSVAGVGSHSEQEFNRYSTETQTAAIDIAARSVANGYNDDTLFQHNLADALRAANAKSALAGGNDAMFANNRAQAAQTLYTARAVAMGTADPTAGLAFVQANADKFDAISLHRLTDEFKTGADKAAVAGGVSAEMSRPVSGGGAPGGAAAGPASLDLKSAIRGQEGSSATSVSVDGARGEGQIIPATFQQYARPGERIDNPADNKAVSDRIIDDLSKRFNGDPARVAVGYFSGPGNVAPAGSATPWIADHVDGDGFKTSAYVAGVLSRLPAAGQGSGGDPSQPQSGTAHDPAPYGAEFARMQQAREHAATLFPNRPDLQRQMVEGVWTEIQQANVLQAKYEAEQAKQTKDAQQAAGQTFMKQILTDPKSIDTAALKNDPSLTWEQKNDLFNIAQKHLQEVAGGREAQTYGSGFWSAYQQVHSADPATKINDPAQLWNRGGPNGDLTLAGIQQLTSEINGTRTPEGAAEGATKKAYLEAAHVAISGHGMFGGQRDAQGELNYARFLTQALPEMERDKAAGMTLSQSLAKDGPLDKLMHQFQRTPAQMMQDMLGDNNPDLPGAKPAAAAKVDLSTAAGITSAYKSGYFGAGPAGYDKAAAELQKRGFVKPPVAALAAPSAPY
jgi:hypothetical protein